MAIQGVLYFHTNCEIICSSSVKNTIGILIGIALHAIYKLHIEFYFFFLSFFNLDSFYFFFCFIPMAKTSKTMLNSSGESGPPCLIPDFRGNTFNFSPLSMFAVGLSGIAFIMLRYVPSMPAFWRIFYHKWVLNFVKGFLCIY